MHHADPATDHDSDRPGPNGPWRERVRGGHPDPSLAAREGVEFLRALLAGATPEPPLSRLTGMRLVQFGDGRATFSLPVTGWLCRADDRVPLGPLTIPADAAMACAIITGLGPTTALTTTELALRQVRPALPGDTLLAHATVLEPGPPVALAEVSLTDGDGQLIAHGSSLCVTLPFSAAAADQAAEDPAAAAPAESDPDPWQRPAPPPDAAEAPAGGAGAGPLGRLTGLRPVSAGRGEATFALPTTRWLCAPPPGRVQGGAVALLADAALSTAVQTAAPAGTTFVPIELKLNYLRPLPSDGREARAHAQLVHGGRRIAVARAEVTDADGRVIAVASGSAISEGSGASAVTPRRR
jgi:uncharacterized protein (TIGR00369 family)